MAALYNETTLKGRRLRNKICVPPMVCFGWSDDSGVVKEKHLDHYRKIAKGKPGLIIQEATCVKRGGRLYEGQLGIWEDDQIEGLKKIADAVHEEGVPILIQIHHAGVVGVEDTVCPSAYSFEFNGVQKNGRELSLAEVEELRDAFIQGARRAYQAGFDGVELHGCHNYLLCEFLNRQVNKRTDRYGEPARLAIEILEGIRKQVPDDFIIGLRLGGFEPTLADAIRNGKALAAAGIDFLNISYGFANEAVIEVPEDWPLKDIHYSTMKIKEQVDVPVFAVFGINTVAKAEAVLEQTKADLVNIGRGILVNYDWPEDGRQGRDVGTCLYCKSCMWRVDADRCPGRKLVQKKRGMQN